MSRIVIIIVAKNFVCFYLRAYINMNYGLRLGDLLEDSVVGMKNQQPN